MENKRKIIIGIIGTIIIVVATLVSNWYVQWHTNSASIETCDEAMCCKYNATDNLWEYTCDASIFSGKERSPGCCKFVDQNLCMNYCSTEFKKVYEPKIPKWLKLLNNFF